MKEPSEPAITRWTSHFRIRDTGDRCTHDQVTETANYGLQRIVCGDCGHVSVGYLHDIFEGRQLDSQPGSEGATSAS